MFGHLDLTGMCDNESCLYAAFMFHSLDFTDVNRPLLSQNMNSDIGDIVLKIREVVCGILTAPRNRHIKDGRVHEGLMYGTHLVTGGDFLRHPDLSSMRLELPVYRETCGSGQSNNPVIVKQPSRYFPCRGIAPSEKPAGDSRTRLVG
jgi:hypothetical protein